MRDRDKERIFDMFEGAAWGGVAAWGLVILSSVAENDLSRAGRLMLWTMWWPLLWAGIAIWFGRLRSAAFWRQFGGRPAKGGDDA